MRLPTAPPARGSPCARSRSRCGSQSVKIRVRFGKHPASPMPKSVRVTSNETKFHAHPVAAVKNDHQTTIRVSTRRGPSDRRASRRDLEQRIGPAEHREGPCHLDFAEAEIFAR